MVTKSRIPRVFRMMLWWAMLVATGATAAVRPSPGLWWQPGQNGQFISVHIGPGDYVLVTLSSGENGRPTYRVMQGLLTFTEDTRDDVIAMVQSPLYRVDGATCLTCGQGDAETVRESNGEYVLSFLSGTRATLRTDEGQTVSYELFPLYTNENDTLAASLPGRLAVAQTPNSAGLERSRGLVQLVELTPDQLGECSGLSQPGDTVLHLRPVSGFITPPLSFCFSYSYLAVSAGPNPRIRLLSAAYPGCEPVGQKIGPQRSCRVAAEIHQSGQTLSGHSMMRYPGEVTLTILEP